MKSQIESINIEVSVKHYGFYSNDACVGDKFKSYRDWIETKTGKNFEEYSPGSYATDMEMVQDWIEETNQPYEALWSESDDGIYLVDKDWKKQI